MQSHRNGVKCTRGKRARPLSKTPAALQWPRLPKPLLLGHTKVCLAPTAQRLPQGSAGHSTAREHQPRRLKFLCREHQGPGGKMGSPKPLPRPALPEEYCFDLRSRDADSDSTQPHREESPAPGQMD